MSGEGDECEVWGKEGYGVRDGTTLTQNAINNDLHHRITVVNITHHYAQLSQPGLYFYGRIAGPVCNTVI